MPNTKHVDGQKTSGWAEAWKNGNHDTAQWTIDPRSPLQKLWGRCAGGVFCTCGAGGGFLAGHAGCIIAPSLAFLTASTGMAMDKPLMIGTSVLLTGAGVAVWYRIRGTVASPIEKAIMAASVAGGLYMGVGPHLAHLDHYNALMDSLNNPIICKSPPPSVNMTPAPVAPK